MAHMNLPVIKLGRIMHSQVASTSSGTQVVSCLLRSALRGGTPGYIDGLFSLMCNPNKWALT